MFYEAPHRIVECLEDMALVIGGERRIVLARELTKTFETVSQHSLTEMLAWVKADSDQQRGEIVLVLEGMPEQTGEQDWSEADRVLGVLLAELPVKQAAALAAGITGLKKNALYERALILLFCASAPESAGRSLPAQAGGGKSGLHRAKCQVTPGRREPTESATES
jgi:16S rRNA (cytidine1402-2'-O)-methyltransferase